MLSVVLISLLLISRAYAQINPSFELPSLGPNTLLYLEAGLDNWSVGGSFYAFLFSGDGGFLPQYPPVPADGVCNGNETPDPTTGCTTYYQYLQLGDGPTISQTLNLVEGHSYTFRFYFANLQYYVSPGAVTTITIGDIVIAQSIRPVRDGAWHYNEYKFTVPGGKGGLQPLTFYSIFDNGEWSSSHIDGVCLSDDSSPTNCLLHFPDPPGEVLTDPHFIGHFGQHFDVTPAAGECLNIYSTRYLQLSGQVQHLTSGLSPIEKHKIRREFAERNLPFETQTFGQEGEYITTINIRLGGKANQDELLVTVQAGEFTEGFKSVVVRRNNTLIDLSVSENKKQRVEILGKLSNVTTHGFTASSASVIVPHNYITIELLDPYRIHVSSFYFQFSILNSDHFLNIEGALPKRFKFDFSEISGILGKTVNPSFPADQLKELGFDAKDLNSGAFEEKYWRPNFFFNPSFNKATGTIDCGDSNFPANQY
jgi:hypothetical protein